MDSAVNAQRVEIMHELARRYEAGGAAGRLRFLRKKYVWLAVAGGARLDWERNVWPSDPLAADGRDRHGTSTS